MSSELKITYLKHASSGSNNLVLASDGTSSFSGNVGIGTTTPTDYYYDDLVVNAGDEGGLTIVDTSSGQSSLAFGDGTSGNARYRGRVLYDHNTDTIYLGSAGETQLNINSSGLTTLWKGLISTSENSHIFEVNNGATSTSGPGAILTTLHGNSANTNCFHLKGTTGSSSYYLYGNGTNSFSSDERLKKGIETTRDGYIDDIKKLRVVKYHWKDQDENSSKELGLIAQEVEQVFPGLIKEHELEGGAEDVKHIKFSVIPMILLKGIQEQQTQIEKLTTRIQTLENA